ncbi:MAG: hypothetical protein FJ267_13365, partial [Planctomycetes bacterium]|nr:hypothetical protein [Planctomycetota bacterium]
MLKKILLGSAAVVALATFMFGREAVSYVRAGINNVRGVVKSEIPLEFEIERAKTLVDQLVPDIRNCMHVIAEQQVDIEHLNDAIAKKESGLQKQKGSILAMRADLGTGKNTFVYASRTFSSNDVKQDLANR